MGLALGGWMAAPTMAATGGVPGGQCCRAEVSSQCCEQACCHTPAQNPLQLPAYPSTILDEGPRDGKFGWSGFALPDASDSPSPAGRSCCPTLSVSSDLSLFSQHVRLQI